MPAGLENDPAPALVVTDRAGRPLRELPAADGTYARPALPLADISPLLRQATLAAEDQRFFDHGGVDWRATARAVVSQFTPGQRRSGGSTVSQQLIKLAAPPAPTRSWSAKAGRMARALRLEQVWDKTRILAAYLNRLPYGNGHVGCAAAAEGYFGKPTRDLSVAEAAFLAALPQAPSRLNPYRHFARAKRRQEWVLGRMRENGVLSMEDLARAVAEPLRLRPRGRVFRAGHFVDLLQVDGAVPRAVDCVGTTPGISGASRNQTARGTAPSTSLFLRSTLDLALNEFTETELCRQLAGLSAQGVSQGAVVVLDNRTGDVLALVGSRDYGSPRAGQVNGATAPRSPGSALKPFTYWLALENGANPATVLADLPAEFPTRAGGVYRPENYGRRCSGPVALRTALACSLNIPAVRILSEQVPGGPAALRQRLMDCGLQTLARPAAHYGLGLTLGDAEVRLLELTNAYACLARLGEYRPVRLLVNEPPTPGRQVGDPRAAFLIADILADNAARAPAFGLDTPLRFAFPVAVKTGTSTDFRDNWALGFTPEFTVGVWVGNFDGRPMAGVSGVSGAGPLLHALFERLHDEHGTGWYATPAGIVEGAVHPLSGHRLASDTAGGVMEKFLVEHPPAPEEPAQDYDASGRVRLPAAYAAWLAGGEGSALADRAVADAGTGSPSGNRFAIVSPLPGSAFGLDPELPESSRRLRLLTRGDEDPGRPSRWECATLILEPDAHGPGMVAALRAGRHVLRARDPATGECRETWIVVRPL